MTIESGGQCTMDSPSLGGGSMFFLVFLPWDDLWPLPRLRGWSGFGFPGCGCIFGQLVGPAGEVLT